jgi:hypothetical protein
VTARAHVAETWKAVSPDSSSDVDYDRNGLETLDRETCLQLLATSPVGRIGISINALPAVLPVNFLVTRSAGDEESLIVLRVGPGAKLTAALSGTVVAFEADGYDPVNHQGWSVLVQGNSRVIDDPAALAWAADLPLQPWAVADAQCFVTITVVCISGRRFGIHPRVV